METDWYEWLERFKDLGDNWDSYGAGPIEPKAIAEAKEFLDLFLGPRYKEVLYPRLFMAPTRDGGIGFELEMKWDGGLKGIMFSCGGAESDQFYIYEEGGPSADEFNICWELESSWSEVFTVEDPRSEIDTILSWLSEKSHTCLNDTLATGSGQLPWKVTT